MHRLINSVATIEINEELAAVVVNLKGYGHFNQYLETFRMASSFADLHGIHAYLLLKPHFKDITYRQFYNMVVEWLTSLKHHSSCKSSGKTKVALLLDKPAFLKLSDILYKAEQELPIEYYHVCCDIFFASHKAHHFLLPKTNKKIYQDV